MNLNIRAAVLKMKSEGVRSRFGTNSHPGKSNMIIQYPLTLMSFPRSRSIFLWSRREWPKCSLVLASRFPAVSSLRRSRPCPRGNYGIRRVKMRMEHYIFGKIIPEAIEYTRDLFSKFTCWPRRRFAIRWASERRRIFRWRFPTWPPSCSTPFAATSPTPSRPPSVARFLVYPRTWIRSGPLGVDSEGVDGNGWLW